MERSSVELCGPYVAISPAMIRSSNDQDWPAAERQPHANAAAGRASGKPRRATAVTAAIHSGNEHDVCGGHCHVSYAPTAALFRLTSTAITATIHQAAGVRAAEPRAGGGSGAAPIAACFGDRKQARGAGEGTLIYLWSAVDPTLLPSPLSCYGPLTGAGCSS